MSSFGRRSDPIVEYATTQSLACGHQRGQLVDTSPNRTQGLTIESENEHWIARSACE